MHKSIMEIIRDTEINYADEMMRIELIFSTVKIVEHWRTSRIGLPETTWMSIQDYIHDFLFVNYKYSGTYISIRDMRNGLNISKEDIKKNNKETMLTYFEFILNMVFFFTENKFRTDRYDSSYINKLISNINKVLEKINYEVIAKNNYLFIIENDAGTSAVAELYPDLSNSVIEYRRHDLKGNIEAKRNILQTLQLKIEGIELKLRGSSYQSLSKNLMNLFNNLHIRHNNKGENPRNNKINMSDEELEIWYDRTYDLTLTALMICNYLDYHKEIEKLYEHYE